MGQVRGADACRVGTLERGAVCVSHGAYSVQSVHGEPPGGRLTAVVKQAIRLK